MKMQGNGQIDCTKQQQKGYGVCCVWLFVTPWIVARHAPLSMEGVAISSSRGSSQPRDPTQVLCIAGRFLTIWVTREAHNLHSLSKLHMSARILEYVTQEYWSGSPIPSPGDFPDPLMWGFLHCRWLLHQLSHQGSPTKRICVLKSIWGNKIYMTKITQRRQISKWN